MHSSEVLIIGSGLAALTTALHLAEHKQVTISPSASYWTAPAPGQGGIAAVLDSHDSVEAHIRDTLIAGACLCDEAVATAAAPTRNPSM